MVFARGDIAVDDVRFGRQTELRDRVSFVDEKGLSALEYAEMSIGNFYSQTV